MFLSKDCTYEASHSTARLLALENKLSSMPPLSLMSLLRLRFVGVEWMITQSKVHEGYSLSHQTYKSFTVDADKMI